MRVRLSAVKRRERRAETFGRRYAGRWVRMRGHGPSRWVAMGDLSDVMPNNLVIPKGVDREVFVQSFVSIAAVRQWVDRQDRKTGLELERFIAWVDRQEPPR